MSRVVPRSRGRPSRSRPGSSDSCTPCGCSRRPSQWSRCTWDTPADSGRGGGGGGGEQTVNKQAPGTLTVTSGGDPQTRPVLSLRLPGVMTLCPAAIPRPRRAILTVLTPPPTPTVFTGRRHGSVPVCMTDSVRPSFTASHRAVHQLLKGRLLAGERSLWSA